LRSSVSGSFMSWSRAALSTTFPWQSGYMVTCRSMRCSER
jgi:hypothetical protein